MNHAKSYLPIDREYIPTGTIESVEHTPFNFLDQRRIKKYLKQTHMQLSIAGGIDHTFVFSELRSFHEPIACVYSFDTIAKVNADCPNKNQKGHP